MELCARDSSFQVNGSDSPAKATQPAPAGIGPSASGVIAPDQLQNQAMVPAGPYAGVGLVDGSVQTGFSLPSYNPNVAPLGLVYNSAAAHPQTIFTLNYLLSNWLSIPSYVNAQLTLSQSGTTVFTGALDYDNVSALNQGDTLVVGLHAGALSLATGRTRALRPAALYCHGHGAMSLRNEAPIGMLVAEYANIHRF